MKHSTWGLVVLIFVVGAAIGFGLGSRGRSGDSMPSPTPRGDACTQEAKLCSDGSSVGRAGPDCEFAPCPGTRRVLLYYYNAQRDKDVSGNLLCGPQGLVAVVRDIPFTKTPIGDTIRTLLRGELTPEDKAQGISTEYPLPGLALVAASLHNGALTLTFKDPGNNTGGGSCRVSILRAQIEATAKQFEEVNEVQLKPDAVFQP